MRNSDLIAFLKPITNQFSRADSVEFIDVTGQVIDIRANSYRLSIRLNLPAGLYRGRFETTSGAFDMSTAMIPMVRVPDGEKVLVGPWDLDHIHNVMAVPMARTYLNGELKGGLWFAMPGPDQIADGRLAAEFGFEAQEGENQLTLELVERDRERMSWGRLAHLELRVDDRRAVSLKPTGAGRPRIFLIAEEVEQLRARWSGRPELEALQAQLRTEELTLLTDNSQGTLALACLMYALTGDAVIGTRAKAQIMALARAQTWSGRPDPLLMGGENDRGIGLRLYHAALAWDYLQPLFNERSAARFWLRSKSTCRRSTISPCLQRAYMGCPAVDPHSLGSWNGAAIACMAFYEDLAIARHALPFFHGLFCDSLKLFPASGKAAWATYFPFHLVLYLAAAHTFGGKRSELSTSAFLDNLGQALLAAYEVPNSQELQRGLRTREHRFLTAFLCRFHPTPGIDSVYRAFAERELKATGELSLGIFDLLYAPASSGPIASFPDRPLFAKDVGDLIATARGEQVIAVALSGGPKSGRQAVFTLMPHNREFAPSLGALEVTIDGTPVLCNVNMGLYGLNSALTNTMCFEDGGALTNGQYLNGDIPPECSAVTRRCLIGERFVYAHIVVTHALDPKLEVRRADRILVFDRRSGVIVLLDSFAGDKPIRFATHLHCSGSIQDLGDGQYRLTGGQANLIAGIKGGSKGLDDKENGEVFVKVIDSMNSASVVVEEPAWVPAYIYGLNNTGQEPISEGRFPRYQRWRLAAEGPVVQGSFLVAISPRRDQVQSAEGAILLPHGGGIRLGPDLRSALGVECECECLLWNETMHCVTAMGLRSLRHNAHQLAFEVPVDIEYNAVTGEGEIYAQGVLQPQHLSGFSIGPWRPVAEEGWKTHNSHRASFVKSDNSSRKEEQKA
jgi:hypothetical protein